MLNIESLGTIAQVGVGLAGFSGIALILTQGSGALTRFEAYRLGIMLGTTLGATFLALLPLVLRELDVSPGDSLRIVSFLMALFSAGFFVYFVVAVSYMRAHVPELVSPIPVVAVLVGHAANALTQLISAVNASARAPGLYALGLLWLLTHGAYQFARILFIRPQTPRDDLATTAGGALTTPAVEDR